MMGKLKLDSEIVELDFRPLLKSQVEICLSILQGHADIVEAIVERLDFNMLQKFLVDTGLSDIPTIKWNLTKLSLDVRKRFAPDKMPEGKIHVLVDLGGSLFIKCKTAVAGAKADIKYKVYTGYFRPGYRELLHTLNKHPRCKLGFYSSIMRQNIRPYLEFLLTGDLAHLLEDSYVFDQYYCKKMAHNKIYQYLAENPWDTYRDLTKVWKDGKGLTR